MPLIKIPTAAVLLRLVRISLFWDESGRSRANAVELLEGIRAFRLELPLIVFASSDPEHVRENRLKALSLGAFEYTWTFEGLFSAIENIFEIPVSVR